MIIGSSPPNAAQLIAKLNSASKAYAHQVIPRLESFGAGSSTGQFTSLIEALEKAESCSMTAADDTHPALAEAISALASDTDTLGKYVLALAECVLSGTDLETLMAPTEICFNLVVVLWVMRTRGVLRGQHFHVYLMAYGLFRFGHERLRDTAAILGPLSGYQVAAVAVFCLGLGGFLKRRHALQV